MFETPNEYFEFFNQNRNNKYNSFRQILKIHHIFNYLNANHLYLCDQEIGKCGVQWGKYNEPHCQHNETGEK